MSISDWFALIMTCFAVIAIGYAEHWRAKCANKERRKITHVRVGGGDYMANQEDIEKVAKEINDLKDGDLYVTHHLIKLEEHEV